MVKITKELLADGKTLRWRARGVHCGTDPVTGKRMQRTISGPTKKAVEAEVRRIGAAIDKGVYVKPWDGSVNDLVDAYLPAAGRGKEENTKLSYANALRIPRERLGRRRALSVTRKDIDDLVDFALTAGRKIGGKPGTGLGTRSVRLMLQQLSAAFERAVDEGQLPKNPCRRVKVPEGAERESTTWSEGQLRRFLAAAAGDRLFACWLLSLLGLRRGEVLGLKWGDISLTEGTLAIARTRVLVEGVVVEKGPKSRRSKRTLPLFEPVTGALEALYTAQLAEKAAAGPAYAVEVDDGYVCADELGRPVHPEWYSDEFHRIAGTLPRIRLHDTRGSVNSYLERLGVPETLRAEWLGHTVAVNRQSYLARPEDLTSVGAAIGSLFGAVPS
jgi:integrase